MTTDWQTKLDIAWLRGELARLRGALGASTPDEAIATVIALRQAVAVQQQNIGNLVQRATTLEQRITALENIIASQGHASIGMADSGAAQDSLASTAALGLGESGSAADSLTTTTQ